MKKSRLLTTMIFCIMLACTPSAQATSNAIIIDDYKNGLDAHWQKKSFSGETHYMIEENDKQPSIHATSDGAASGLFFKIDFDPLQYPILSWSWKIDHVLEKGDARTKQGDDYAARVYVVFPSWLFWKTRALNYVWANTLPKENFIANAFTANAMMIAVRSGPAGTGQWHTEQRNIYEDYKRAFGEEPT
ncbi:MAG: DUF3047 domain-containing protein, partial [Desulfobulbaceae bacterium]|nr:DUF3047 domain-containing protein [Desulfobulbaceae bacterium]